VNKMSTMPNNS